MSGSFATLRPVLALLALAAVAPLAAAAAPSPAPLQPVGTPPPPGKYKECHGFVRHVAETTIKAHCIDGVPSDQSFAYVPRYAKLKDGVTPLQAQSLAPETPIHIYYTQTLGVKKAVRIEVLDEDGNVRGTIRS